MSNGQQEQNCAWGICCNLAQTIASLAAAMERHGCRTPGDCAAYILEHHTLAPLSFQVVKDEIARAARA